MSFASAIGAMLAFLAARWPLGGRVPSRFGDRLTALNAGISKEGGFHLFTLRLVPVLTFLVINLAMGVTTLPTWTFYWLSQLGMLAGTLVYVNAGTQLARIEALPGIDSPGVLGSPGLLGVFPLIASSACARPRPIENVPSTDPLCPGCMDALLQGRHHSLFAPRDFDVSPYFAVIKPLLVSGFDHRTLAWHGETPWTSP